MRLKGMQMSWKEIAREMDGRRGGGEMGRGMRQRR